MTTTMNTTIASQRNGIDLNQYEIGTLFEYTPASTWCRDGQAEIREMNGERYLVDTYWGSGFDGALTVEQGREAKAFFVPSQYREVTAQEARVYGDKVTTIRSHAGHRVAHYVNIDEPKLTEVDHYRQMLAEEEERLAGHQRGVESSAHAITFIRAHIEKLENQS